MLETHWHECWRYTSHHACAVLEIERLQEELAQSVLNLEGHKKANLQLKEDLRLEAAAYQAFTRHMMKMYKVLQSPDAALNGDIGVLVDAIRGLVVEDNYPITVKEEQKNDTVSGSDNSCCGIWD